MLGEVLSIVTALMWAASTILSASVLKDIDSLSVNAIKTLFAAISMLPIAIFMGEIQLDTKIDYYGLFFVVLAAIIGFGLGDTCLFKSITLIGVSRSYMLAHTSPFFTLILATLFLGEPFCLRYLIGIVIIFAGIITVLMNKNTKKTEGNHKGYLIAFVTAILWSMGATFITFGLKSINVILANTVRYPILFLFLFLSSRLWKKNLTLTKTNIMRLALSGIIGMTFGGIAFLYSVQLIGVSRTIPLSSSSPVLVSLMSSIFLKEKVTWRMFAASIMVILGTYFLA